VAGAALALIGAMGFAAPPAAAVSANEPGLLERLVPRRADFRSVSPGDDARYIADWVVQSRDHEGMPFMIIDKRAAQLFVFDRRGLLVAASPVLIGAAVGDVFEAGVEDMDMFETRPWQRITPAGRFRADLSRTPSGQWQVWVDYDTGIALHRIAPMSSAQRRFERIASADPLHRRITYGCINVPGRFFDDVVYPLMRGTDAMVYVLPETQPARRLFAAHTLPQRASVRHELALGSYSPLHAKPARHSALRYARHLPH
jgi:hypothetical protein